MVETPAPAARAGRGTTLSTRLADKSRQLVKHGRSDQLVRSSVAVMSTTIGNSALGYVFWVLSARNISATGVGAAGAIVSLATIAATFSDLGLRTALMQKLPLERGREEWSRRVSSALLVGLSSSFVLGVTAVLLAPRISTQLRDFMDPTVVVCIVLLTMSGTIFNLLDGVSMSEHRAGQIPLRGAIMGVVKVALLALAVSVSGDDARAILVATVAGTGVAAAWGAFRQVRKARSDWQFRIRGSMAGVRDMGTTLIGHHLVNLGGWLPAFVLPLEVVARSSTEQNAYMTVTWMMGLAFFMVSPAVASALFVQGRWNPTELRVTTRRATKLIALLLTPAALVVVLAGHYALSLFGADYAKYGYPLLLVLLISSVPDAITNVRIGRLRALAQLATAARMNLGMAVVSITLAWFLIPQIGIVGVGVAWLSAQTVGAVWGLFEDGIRSRKSGNHGARESGDRISARVLLEREEAALHLLASARPASIALAGDLLDSDKRRRPSPDGARRARDAEGRLSRGNRHRKPRPRP